MHIVFLAQAFPIKSKQTGGGAANYIANMSRILSRNGHKVTVITEANDEEVFEWEGICVHHIRATRYFKDTGRRMTTRKRIMKNIWRSIWYNYEVYKINKRDKIDIVQGTSTYNISLLRCKSIPYMIRISEHPTLLREASRETYNFEEAIKREKLDDKMFFMALKRADMLVAPSYCMKDIVRERIDRSVTVIESPVILTDYRSDVKKRKKRYFLTFGLLSYRKSVHILAQIIDKLLDEYIDMEYVLVGKDIEVMKGGQYVWCSELIKSMVVRNRDRLVIEKEIFDRNTLFSLIKHAQLCILPSRSDNLSNACLEAMALGKIVISTDKSSAEQLITDGYNGFLTKMDDAEELYRKVRYVINLSDQEKEAIGSRAEDRVQDLTPEKVYVKMMTAYAETIDRFRRRISKDGTN
jgi:glycosyltransferase involved in cell wall biosynthesis